MAKEIAEQPAVIGEAPCALLTADGEIIACPITGLDFHQLDRNHHGRPCGRPFMLAQRQKYCFEQIARLPVEGPMWPRNSGTGERRFPTGRWPCFVSQCPGETADTALAALRYCAARLI